MPALKRMTEIQELKQAIRREVRQSLRQLTPPEKTDAARQAAVLLLAQPVWNQSRSVLFYAPLSDELDLSPIWPAALASGKILAFPAFDSRSGAYQARVVENLQSGMVNGSFGVREPASDAPLIPLNQLDLLLVPGVAFDPSGFRLGRGKGFYDRLLASAAGIKCGVAFEQQLISVVPSEIHDVRVDTILTPTRWLKIEPQTGS
jgi:5-formyltetrahydrofolate cyclo-ligase